MKHSHTALSTNSIGSACALCENHQHIMNKLNEIKEEVIRKNQRIQELE